MASGKKTAKKGSRPSPKKAKGKPKPAAKAVKKITIDARRLVQMKEAEKKRIEAERAREKKRLDAERARTKKLLEAERARAHREAAKMAERAKKEAEKAADKARKDAEKAMEKSQRDSGKAADKARREAEKVAEKARKEAERNQATQKRAEERAAAVKAKEEARAAAQKAREDARAAAQAEKDALKLASKKKVIPLSSIAATPVIRPLGSESVTLAPPPAPSKPGHVDHQILSALSYGIFSAVNKTFGFAGQSVVKNASLRMLEYGYKRGWLPPKSKEPIRALNEFFGRLETMGYAEKIHIAKRGDNYQLEVAGLADFDAVHSLRELHYPLLPIFLGEMLSAIVDQYFRMRVTLEPIEFQEQKRGFTLPFSIHEPTAVPELSRLATVSRVDDFEE